MISPQPHVRLAGGRYELTELMAVGGMSQVWTAVDHSSGRVVAVKMLRDDISRKPSFQRRLRSEARSNAQVAHPNVAAIYDFREEEGTGYLVMELVRGQSLAQALRHAGRLPLPRLLPILSQAARALDATHRAGLVHRDIKPGNLLITPEGEVKLTDFGLAIESGKPSLTELGAVPGTAAYLAPEQSLGRPASSAADIYALGVVAYEAVAGRRPFAGNSDEDMAVAHLREPVPPLPADVEPMFARLVMEMLAKQPASRPGPASILAGRFDAMALGDHVPDAGHSPSPEAASRPPTGPDAKEEPPPAPAAGASRSRLASASTVVGGSPARSRPQPAPPQPHRLGTASGIPVPPSGHRIISNPRRHSRLELETGISWARLALMVTLAVALLTLVIVLIGKIALGSTARGTDPATPVTAVAARATSHNTIEMNDPNLWEVPRA